jgi:hypothetical protein
MALAIIMVWYVSIGAFAAAGSMEITSVIADVRRMQCGLLERERLEDVLVPSADGITAQGKGGAERDQDDERRLQLPRVNMPEFTDCPPPQLRTLT